MPQVNKSQANQIGRYRLDDKLGEGGAGMVFRAYDPVMDRSVAIKSVKTEKLTAAEIKHMVDAFHHEAKIAGKFAHENIVSIYDVISHGGSDHIVMEHIPGRSVLDYMIAVGPFDPMESLSVVHKVCVGLAYIHYHGVIHRDIKPGNIMYHPGQSVVKVMDFSVAHNIEDAPVRDIGTIGYMAPEHFDPNRRITFLTDIFALGSTLYRMLTKKYPFTRENTAHQILHQHPVPITDLRPEVPQEVADIVSKAMAKADADRFQSAAAFAREIEVVMNRLYPDAELMSAENKYMSG